MSAEPPPPQNLAAEERLLGAILLAGTEARQGTVTSVRATGLVATDFYLPRHALVFQAALAVEERGKPTDVLVVADELRARGKLDAAGGTERLIEIAGLVPVTANASHYAEIVIDAAERRAEATAASALGRAARNGGLSASPGVREQLVAIMEPSRSADLTWLESACDLLAEPDPGPTPFLVEQLIVERAILALVGTWKVAKTWTLLELALAIVTGRDAFGTYPVVEPGPVILVLEESGRDALHRRLDLLRRGYGLTEAQVADLHFSANRRVRLNDPSWQERLLAAAAALNPRAIFFDPFVRLKGAEVNESDQHEIGPVLDFIRDLRDEAAGVVGYASHTGHEGGHQRGSSDLEGYWESRLALEKAKDDEGVRIVSAEHREAESGHQFRFGLDFDATTRSLRLRAITSEAERLVEAYRRANPDASKNEVAAALDVRRADVLRLYDEVEERLRTPRLEGT